jgi:hypothetical protein
MSSFTTDHGLAASALALEEAPAPGSRAAKRAERDRLEPLIRAAVIDDGLSLGDAARTYGVDYDRAWNWIGRDPEVRPRIHGRLHIEPAAPAPIPNAAEAPAPGSRAAKRAERDRLEPLIRAAVIDDGLSLGDAARKYGQPYDRVWNWMGRDEDIRPRIHGRLDIEPASAPIRPLGVAGASAFQPKRADGAPMPMNEIIGSIGDRMRQRFASPAPKHAPRPAADLRNGAVPQDRFKAWREESCDIMLAFIDHVVADCEAEFAPKVDSENSLCKQAEDLALVVVWKDVRDGRTTISTNPCRIEDFLNRRGYFHGDKDDRFSRLYDALMGYMNLLTKRFFAEPMRIVGALATKG